jgi:hypothetical protein
VTLTNSTLHSFSNHSLSLAASCNRWSTSDCVLFQCSQECALDPGIADTFTRVHVHDCGLSGFALSGRGSRVELSQANACTASGVEVRPPASGIHILRRNTLWDCASGITVQPGTTADVRMSNNSFIGGRVAGAASATAYSVSAAGNLAIENNLSAGNVTTALLVAGIDAGTLADGGSEQNPVGYTERGNAFDTSGGQLLSYGGSVLTADNYVATVGDGGTFFGDPGLLSINPSSPNFTPIPDSGIRDIGVFNPATGTMNNGCDGGIDSYCGAAPEPGAVELP